METKRLTIEDLVKNMEIIKSSIKDVNNDYYVSRETLQDVNHVYTMNDLIEIRNYIHTTVESFTFYKYKYNDNENTALLLEISIDDSNDLSCFLVVTSTIVMKDFKENMKDFKSGDKVTFVKKQSKNGRYYYCCYNNSLKERRLQDEEGLEF